MNIRPNFSSPRGERGNVLFMTMIFCGVVGAVLLSYLTFMQARVKVRARSQAWNTAMPLAEAGVEEAFTHLRRDISAPVANGWTNEVIGGQTANTKRRTFPDGSYFYAMIYNATTNNPRIYSSGFVPTPSGSGYLSRTVQTTTTNDPIFVKALVVKKTVTSNGNSVTADAFDSGSPLYSTNGQYVASKAQDGGGIATLSGAANALNFGGGTVNGPVATGSGGSIPSSLNVGTRAWLAGPHSGNVQPGYFTTDMNVTFQDVTVDAALATAGILTQSKISSSGVVYPLTSILGGLTTAWVLIGGNNYRITNGTLSGKVVVIGPGTANLLVTSNAAVNFSASADSISISNNVNFQMFVGSPTVSLPNVANSSGYAANFTYLGLPTNTNLTMQVNANFVGTMYAPNANVTLGGNGGGSDQKIIGAMVSNTMNFNDLFSFHYDNALARTGLSRGYLMTSWREM